MGGAADTKPPTMLAVYDGRNCVGHLLARGKLGFEAFDATEVSRGIFQTADAAANALTPIRDDHP